MSVSLRAWAALVLLAVGACLTPTLRARDDGASELQLQFADLLFSEERYAEAVNAYELARSGATGQARWRADLGLVKSLLRIAEFRRARAEAADLVAAQPSNGQALALYGEALWAAGLFDQAESRFREAATLVPSDARARSGLAKSLAARGLIEEALSEARAAVALSGREPEFHFTLGFVLQQARRYDEAAVAIRSYLNLLPNRDRSEKALWANQQARFLESFGQREPLAVEPAVAEKTHTVPFRLDHEKVYVRAKVNGQQMDLVLDTGSELTVVSRTTAQRVGLDPVVYTLSAGVGQVGVRGLQLGRMDKLEIGTLKVSNVPTLIKNPPLTGLPTPEAESFSPLSLGFSMHIDYKRRVLTMSRALPQQRYDVELPMRHHRLALVRGVVNGDNPVHFVIDTGGEVISVSKATAETLQLKPPRLIPLKVYGTSGWDPDAFLLPGVDLAFDRIEMPKHSVVVLNLDAPSLLLGFELGGIVGHKFLSRYSVGIDLQRSVLGLTGN